MHQPSGSMQVPVKEFENLLKASAPLPSPQSVSAIDFLALDASVRNDARIEDYCPHHIRAFWDTHVYYEELLKHLRFLKLQLPTDSSVLGWHALLEVWASQCCFLECDYPNWNVRMSLPAEHLDNVGLVTRCILARRDLDEKFEWIPPEAYWKMETITKEEKFCLCTIIRVPDGCVPWELSNMRIGLLSTPASTMPEGSPIRALISTMLSTCADTHCRYGFIADAAYTMFVTWEPRKPQDHSPTKIWYELIPRATHSTVFCIAAVMLRYSFSVNTHVYSRQVAGAANQSQNGRRVFAVNAHPQHFRDFGLYEMEHDSELYESFLRWKVKQSAAALEAPLLPGAELSLQRDVIPRKLEPWRCPFPWVPVPDDCVASIFDRRPRSSQVDGLLRCDSPLVFRINKAVRVGSEAFSQVFTGTLGCAPNGMASDTELCLKLFDERLFPVPSINDYHNAATPRTAHLAALNFPDEMMRREEAVYTYFSAEEPSRGPHLQGLSIPHCYGFHEFTVEDGAERRTMLGFLMEYVKGVPFEEVLEEMFMEDSKWKYEEKFALLKRLRNLVRILNHAHFTHGDWHPAQIICTREHSDGKPLDQQYDFVLLDFAFTRQLDDRRITVPRLRDLGETWDFLAQWGMSEEMTRALGWMERDECDV